MEVQPSQVGKCPCPNASKDSNQRDDTPHGEYFGKDGANMSVDLLISPIDQVTALGSVDQRLMTLMCLKPKA